MDTETVGWICIASIRSPSNEAAKPRYVLPTRRRDLRNGVTLPVPHAYFKSILTENARGTLDLWSFILPNEESDKPLASFLVPTVKIEQYSGINLWNRLQGSSIAGKKRRQKRRMWR